MAGERSSKADYGIGPIEHQLTLHLERAHELSERAQRANDAAQHEIDRALEIAEDICGRMHHYGER
jgi:hypothetical protein